MNRSLSVHTQLILDVANEAYNLGEAGLNLDIANLGDGLATFLRQEIIEVTQGAQDLEHAIGCAIRAIRTAIRELTEVKDALVGKQVDLGLDRYGRDANEQEEG